MIAYASRTGTKRNLAALRAADWRLLVSARGVLRHEGFPYALDNGAWTAHTHDEPFDVPAFTKAVDLLGNDADFVVIPDIVGGGIDSLRYSLSWLPRLRRLPGPQLLAVQDGMTPEDVRPYIGTRIGIAVGGTTEWKIETMRQWGALARESACWLHILRVNSARRIRLCQDAGATSFDGSGPSRFAKALPRLDNARRQMPLWSSLCPDPS